MQLSRCKERKHVKQSYLYQHVFYNLYRFLSLWVYRSKPKTEIEKGKSGGLEKCNIQSFEFIRVFGCQSDLRRNKLQFSLYSNIDLHLYLLKLHNQNDHPFQSWIFSFHPLYIPAYCGRRFYSIKIICIYFLQWYKSEEFGQNNFSINSVVPEIKYKFR